MGVNWVGVVMTLGLLAAGIALVALKQVEIGQMLIAAAAGSLAPNPLQRVAK